MTPYTSYVTNGNIPEGKKGMIPLQDLCKKNCIWQFKVMIGMKSLRSKVGSVVKFLNIYYINKYILLCMLLLSDLVTTNFLIAGFMISKTSF